MVTTLTMVSPEKCIELLNQYVAHLKLIKHCMLIIFQFIKKRERDTKESSSGRKPQTPKKQNKNKNKTTKNKKHYYLL